MKTLNNLYAELGLAPQGHSKTASSKEDQVMDFLKKLAGDSPDPAGAAQVPVNLGEAAANRPNGTSDPSQVLQAFNSREEKPAPVDAATMNASSNPAMTQGTLSHKLNEVPNQAPAQAVTGDTAQLEVVARKVAQILQGQTRTPDVDLDQVYKVAFINDFLGRQAAQAAFLNKTAQEMPPMQDVGPAQAVPQEDPTESILAMLGQVSADELVAKKDQLLAAVADVLESQGESESEGGEKEEAGEDEAEGEAKEAAAKLVSLIQKHPTLQTKVAKMLGK